MSTALELLSAGGGATLQDLGRLGWKGFGVPPGGVMDADSARQANRLVGNTDTEAVVEFLFTGARLRAIQTVELAMTGATVETRQPRWRSFVLQAGEEVVCRECRSGVWSYLAVRGGFEAPRWFGSASVYPRAGLGAGLRAGDRLTRKYAPPAKAVAGRFVPDMILPQYEQTPTIGVYPGPEWDLFSAEARSLFLKQAWTVSQQSDRTGYRLEGLALPTGDAQILSAPLSVGTLQVPPGGKPIVILRDGPTVGGYPRLAILNADEVSRFTQCAPGTKTRFQLIA
ncbi:biotin-dependent carboxyltransferase family protein [soil metagenome]